MYFTLKVSRRIACLGKMGTESIDMDKFKKSVQGLKDIFALVAKYWLPVFLDALYSTFRIGINYIGVGIISSLYSLFITVSRRENLSDFFIPHFWEGLICAFLTILVWRLIVETSQKIRRADVEAKRITWRDIEIIQHKFPDGSGYGLGLQIISHKPAPDRNFGDMYRVRLTEAKVSSIAHHGKGLEYPGKENYSLPILYERGGVYSEESSRDVPHLGNVQWNKMILLIAELQGDRAIIYDKKENPDEKRPLATIDGNNPCWVEIRLKAMVFNMVMEECTVSFVIYYRQSGLEIGNFQRNPEYDN